MLDQKSLGNYFIDEILVLRFKTDLIPVVKRKGGRYNGLINIHEPLEKAKRDYSFCSRR